MINLYLLITLFSNLESAKAPKFIKLKTEKHMLAGLRDAHACLAGIQAICFAVQPSHFSGILFGALRDIPFLFFCFYISNRFFTDIGFCSLIGKTQVIKWLCHCFCGVNKFLQMCLNESQNISCMKIRCARKMKVQEHNLRYPPKGGPREREKHIDLNINNINLR